MNSSRRVSVSVELPYYCTVLDTVVGEPLRPENAMALVCNNAHSTSLICKSIFRLFVVAVVGYSSQVLHVKLLRLKEQDKRHTMRSLGGLTNHMVAFRPGSTGAHRGDL